jgi:predicted DNA-binding ribbon-helix-helix protein
MAKRSITIVGHRTSVSVEEPFWQAIVEIAGATGTSVAALVASIDRERGTRVSLSSALRLRALDWYRDRAKVERDGRRAGT